MTAEHQVPGTKFKFTQRYQFGHDFYERRKRTDYIVVHCSDTPAGREVDAAEIRGWHMKERGWKDIGYHFVIGLSGDIETGRPAWAVGAGVAGYNANSIHICMVGGKGGVDTFSQDQKDSLLFLINTLRGEGKPYEGTEVRGHRDFPNVDKECPSFDAGEWYAAEQSKLKNQLIA